jgi:hypothetical protein
MALDEMGDRPEAKYNRNGDGDGGDHLDMIGHADGGDDGPWRRRR